MKKLGDVISNARKQKGWSLRELAERVKKDDGSPISPQYLNDIEHGNRTPTGQLIDNLAKALMLDRDYLLILSGSQPEEMNKHPEVAAEIVKAYRKHLQGDKSAFKSLPEVIKKLEDSQ